MKNSGCIHFQLKNSSALQASAGTNARHCTAITDNRTAAVIQRNRMTALSNKTSPQSFVSLRSDVPCSTKLPANTPINDTIQKRNINRDNELSTIKSNENTIQLSWLGKSGDSTGRRCCRWCSRTYRASSWSIRFNCCNHWCSRIHGI
ncbi:MAG: hypothetical protein WDO19_15675 [Bacteroidota bacterium]